MSLFGFIKDAGERLFNSDEKNAEKMAASIREYIEKQDLGLTSLDVQFDPQVNIVHLRGFAPSRAALEKAALAAGNVEGVEGVYNHLQLTAQAEAAQQAQAGNATEAPATVAEARFHDVAKGDTLSSIAKQYYGNANDYMKIFEANKPMLSDPNKIYVGQKLRIPE